MVTRDKIASILTLWYDDTMWFPFIETEDGDITGPGHQDKDLFTGYVAAYDRHCEVESEGYSGNVHHQWATFNENAHGEVSFLLCDQDTKGAYPITTMWYQR